MGGKRFENKIAIITGSAGGIGKNIALAFGSQGGRVIICDIDAKKGRAAEQQLIRQKVSAEFLRVDLSQRGAPQRMIQKVVRRFKKLDILVNNARLDNCVGLLEQNEDEWDKTMAVSLKAAFFASQEAIRVMSKTDGGSIVNISSVAALLTCHQSPAYHVAKAALIQMTRYLSAEAGKYGVCVNAILPGFIVKDENRAYYESGNNEQYRRIAEFCHPLGKVGRSDDIANAVLFLCSRDASFISGQALIVDGGLSLQEQSGLLFRFNKKSEEGL